MGQSIPMLEPEQGGGTWRGGPGHCGTTACLLQGGGQDPVSGCLWPGRCPWAVPAPGAAGGLTPAPRPQASPPRQSTGQPPPTAASPRHRGSSCPSSPRGTDPAPRKPGRTGGPRPNPHHPGHRAGEQASLASSNKGRWAAKHLRGLSGVALGWDLPIMHKEGSQHPLSCGHVWPEELKPAPVQPPSQGLCRPRAATLSLTPPGLHEPLFGPDGS